MQRVTELALRLLILTAVRSGPLRNIHESQIDGDVWTIPAEAMKGRKGATRDFRVPLSSEAQAVIDEARKFSRDAFLFPGARKGVISDMTMSKFMERRGMVERAYRCTDFLEQRSELIERWGQLVIGRAPQQAI